MKWLTMYPPAKTQSGAVWCIESKFSTRAANDGATNQEALNNETADDVATSNDSVWCSLLCRIQFSALICCRKDG